MSGQWAVGGGQKESPGTAVPGLEASPVLTAYLLVALLTLPLVGHGCHRDDLDHEPAAAPHRQMNPPQSLELK